MIPQLLIGAPHSGAGKTTFTLGLLRALKNRGYKVQPFKCGPDYIDTKYHGVAAGSPSINLDLYMGSKDHVKNLYASYASKADVCVAEGVMGLFDGAVKMNGSSAEVAETIGAKVLLIMNAKAVAYSVAPLIYGFKNFYKGIDIAGVVFNFVSSESHYSFLKAACDDVGVEALGYIPKNADLEIPSRHLGLSIDNMSQYDAFADKVASIVEKTVDVERIVELYKTEVPVFCGNSAGTKDIKDCYCAENDSSDDSPCDAVNKLKIAVARDEAFNFIYHENIEIMKSLGEVTFFSPLHDSELPDADMVYLAGGYPELYLKDLSENTSMKESIREYAVNGGKLLAECGGMMYLCNNIVDKSGEKYPVCGLLDQDASMENMKLHLGYRRIVIGDKEYKGHEFHYSNITDSNEKDSMAEVYSARDKKLDTSVFIKNNVVASYIHFYWGERDVLSLWR